MSTIKAKNIKQTVVGTTIQPLKIGGILEDGSDAKITIDTSGNLTASNLTATLNGLLTTNGQIKFPATQNPSADANTLDDYEEGTWTPVVYLGGSVAGGTQSCYGTYTKIGRVVHIDVSAIVSSITGTGAYTVGNFPFIISSYTASYANTCAMSRYITFSGYVTAEPNPGQYNCQLLDNVSASVTSAIDKAKLGTSPVVQFKLTYFTA